MNRQVNAHAGRTLITQWLSGLKLRLNEVKDNFGKLNQVIVIKLKAQWLSGLNLRLNEVEDKVDEFNQVIARYLKAQWLSGIKLRLSTCLRPTQLCGGEQTKRKLFNFLLHAYSLSSASNHSWYIDPRFVVIGIQNKLRLLAQITLYCLPDVLFQ